MTLMALDIFFKIIFKTSEAGYGERIWILKGWESKETRQALLLDLLMFCVAFVSYWQKTGYTEFTD